MKKIIFNTLYYLLFVLLSLFLLYFSLKDTDLNRLWHIIKNANYQWIGIALILGFISNIFRAYRWNLLIEPLGYKPKLRTSFYAVLIGYFANLAIPRGGEIAKCGSLSKAEKIPLDTLIGTMIAERAFDMLSLFILTFFVFFAKIKFFGTFILTNIFKPFLTYINTYINSLTMFLTAAVSIFIFIFLLLYYFRKKLYSFSIIYKTRNLLKGVITGITSIIKLKSKNEFLLHTFLIWLMYFLMTYVMFFCIDATSNLSLIDGIFILVFASIGMSIPTPGGFGSFHSLIVLGLSLYNIERNDAMAYAIITHETQALFFIITGFISLILITIEKKHINQ